MSSKKVDFYITRAILCNFFIKSNTTIFCYVIKHSLVISPLFYNFIPIFITDIDSNIIGEEKCLITHLNQSLSAIQTMKKLDIINPNRF